MDAYLAGHVNGVTLLLFAVAVLLVIAASKIR